MKTASWVIIEKRSGKAILETFSQKVVNAINTEKYNAIPISEYLVSINGRKKQNPT